MHEECSGTFCEQGEVFAQLGNRCGKHTFGSETPSTSLSSTSECVEEPVKSLDDGSNGSDCDDGDNTDDSDNDDEDDKVDDDDDSGECDEFKGVEEDRADCWFDEG